MAKILFFSTNGSENPTKAALPFIAAGGALDAGHEPVIALFGDAVVVMKDAVRDAVVPVGWPPVSELMRKVVEHKVPIYV
jgi:predicted peroxiredoxin